jgi:hypothetical protein
VADYGDAKITEKQAKTWATGTPQAWAAESWKLARDIVYREVPPAGDPPAMSEEYIARAQPVVDEQIQGGCEARGCAQSGFPMTVANSKQNVARKCFSRHCRHPIARIACPARRCNA